MTKSLTFLVLAAFCLAAPASADDMQCAKELAVATADAARSIYLREPAGGLRPGRDLVVEDGGDHWMVFQRHRSLGKSTKNPDGTETIVVQTGSDGLVLEIDKCTGATRAHYAR